MEDNAEELSKLLDEAKAMSTDQLSIFKLVELMLMKNLELLGEEDTNKNAKFIILNALVETLDIKTVDFKVVDDSEFLKNALLRKDFKLFTAKFTVHSSVDLSDSQIDDINSISKFMIDNNISTDEILTGNLTREELTSSEFAIKLYKKNIYAMASRDRDDQGIDYNEYAESGSWLCKVVDELNRDEALSIYTNILNDYIDKMVKIKKELDEEASFKEV